MQELRPRLTRDERKAQTRERLVKTAHAMFLQRGYHATSLEEIAAELDLTKGSVYANFASKTDLFLAVFDRRTAARRRGYGQAGSLPLGLEDWARGLARVMAGDDPDGRWAGLLGEVWAVTAGDAAFRAALLDRVGPLHAQIADALEQAALRAGVVFPYPAAEMAPIGGAVLRGLLLQRLLDPQRMPADVVEAAFAGFIRGMACPRPPHSPEREDR
jgi:AcrR family transcriptional regulator